MYLYGGKYIKFIEKFQKNAIIENIKKLSNSNNYKNKVGLAPTLFIFYLEMVLIYLLFYVIN